MTSAMMAVSPSNFATIRELKGQSHTGLKMNTRTNQVYFNTGRVIKIQSSRFVIKASNEKEASLKKLGLTDAECEAAVVAGNAPDAPPVPPKPAAPAGTPLVSLLPLNKRPRRNRKSPVLRASFQETHLSPANFVYPLFIHEVVLIEFLLISKHAGQEDTPIGAMPGCYRLGWRHGLLEEVSKARDVGVNSIVLFPKVPDALKTPTGDESYNENGLVPRAIRLLKDKFPVLVIYTDVALDPYSSDGHDGIVREDGVIMNDETVHQLCKLAVAQARAGADVVSPSDMMDGRVGALRQALACAGFPDVSIMSYAAK
ncbi:hypothetical protein C5167_050210 [Papaver somniferum]|uniref:porphobilinogen synthase n=1 Tax=Papaver somniferum TaxID=3469 RepID=A0A4Y7KPG3_PAPSO|nr:hypothetical protein C5167_050210 [Papaver somniferum]